MSKPAGITTATVKMVGVETTQRIYVVCDDGMVWYLEHPHIKWLPGPTIPGTQAADAADSN